MIVGDTRVILITIIMTILGIPNDNVWNFINDNIVIIIVIILLNDTCIANNHSKIPTSVK